MSSSTFKLLGSFGATSNDAPTVDVPAVLDSRVTLARKHYDELTLTADAFQAVALGGIANVHVLVVQVPGGKATLRLTSAAGAQQLVPVEELFILISLSVPLTSIDVQRPAGVTTNVQVFLGEKS